MKLNLIALGLCCTWVALSGCVSTIDGKRKAGLPLIKDTVEARYERPLAQVWSAAKNVLAANGSLYVENVIGRTLEAKVDTRTVWILVEDLDGKITRVLVQARTKLGGTDLPLASEIDKQIAIRLATGNLTPSTTPAATTAPR